MNRIASRPKNTSYQEQMNYIYNYFTSRKRPDLADKVVKIANHIFKNNTNIQGQAPNSGNNANSTQGQQPAQSDSTPYTINIHDYNINSSIGRIAEEKFGIYNYDCDYAWDRAEMLLSALFDDVAKMGYPAARKKFMEEWGDDDVIGVADYINHNKAQFIKSPEENKRFSDGMRKAYQSNISVHNDVMKHQQSLNNTTQTNNQSSYGSGSVTSNNNNGRPLTGSTLSNTVTQRNNTPTQQNKKPKHPRNMPQKGSLRTGTTFFVDDDVEI